MKNILVCGAGGFIGSHLVQRLKETEENIYVVGIDLKRPLWLMGYADKFYNIDLKIPMTPFMEKKVFKIEYDEIYQLAANDGGIEYTSNPNIAADLLSDNICMNLSLLKSLKSTGQRPVIFFSSSAEVYSINNQKDPEHPKCSEISAYPAHPYSEIGWAKLLSEQLYLAHYKNYKMSPRIGRLHSVYGPLNAWVGGKENVIYSLCKKIAIAKAIKKEVIEIIGDGTQTRSFLYINDCIDAMIKMTRSNIIGPLNIGSTEMVSIKELASIIMDIAGYHPIVLHREGPTGVPGRNSDNNLIKTYLKWEPLYNLVEGLSITYDWVKKQIKLYKRETGVYRTRPEDFGLAKPKSSK